MSIYVISDLHINHANLLKPTYDNRPFSSIEDMNEQLIFNWNSVVSNDDIVFNLGDWFMGQTTEIARYLSRFNGRYIYTVAGNHESKKKIEIYKTDSRVKVISDYMNLIYRHFFFTFAHNPASEYFDGIDWNNPYNVRIAGHWHSQSPVGAQWNWHGIPWNNHHTHPGEQETEEVYLPGLSYNVSADVINYTPIPLDKICEDCMKKQEELSLI